jgi:hypothetical protein
MYISASVFLDGGLHHARHLVGGAAGPGRDHDFNGFCGFPAGKHGRAREHGRQHGGGFHDSSHVFSSFDEPDAGDGSQGAIVGNHDLEFKQASTALMMTFA